MGKRLCTEREADLCVCAHLEFEKMDLAFEGVVLIL